MSTAVHTNSGGRLDFSDLQPTEIHLSDIVCSLSREGRWINSLNVRFSVSQHSCLVHDYCPDEIKRFAILHDGSEAYMRDLPKPLKNLCPGYRDIEQSLQGMIYYKYCGRWPMMKEITKLKKVDLEMTKAEGMRWHPRYDRSWFPGVETLVVPEIASVWDEKRAKKEMYKRLEDLGIRED